MERIALHTSPKGIANLQIFNAPQNFLSKKIGGFKTRRPVVNFILILYLKFLFLGC